MWFSADSLVLSVGQAACVAIPAAGLPLWASRFRGSGWALVAPLSVAVVVGAIAALPSTADVLTWVALVLVPIGAALALGWAAHGARPWLAVLAAPLLAVAWGAQDARAGQIATMLLVAGSVATAGRLLAGASPLTLLKVGVVAMAIVDSILVFSNELQAPNALLVAASPGLGLPRLQSVGFGGAGMGYGDFFAAAVVGAIIAAERHRQWPAALALVVVAEAWDQLFAYYDTLPATVPPAVVLIGYEVWRRRARRLSAARPR